MHPAPRPLPTITIHTAPAEHAPGAHPLPVLFDSKEDPRLVEHSYDVADDGSALFVVRLEAMGRAFAHVRRLTKAETMRAQLEELHAEAAARIADTVAQYVRDEADAQWQVMLKRERAEREMWAGSYTK